MSQSLANQLMVLATSLSAIASDPDCQEQARASELADQCRSYAIKKALKDLKEGEQGYATITASLNAATAAADQANQALTDVAHKLAAVAAALNLAAQLIAVIGGVLG